MTHLLNLPPSAWRDTATGAAADFTAPVTGGVAIHAVGWVEPGAARLVPATGAPIDFRPLGDNAFVATTATMAEAFVIEAPVAPQRCQLVFLAPPSTSPTLSLLAPRAIRRPAHRQAYDLDAGRRRVASALSEQELDTALGVATEMLVVSRVAATTRAAVLDVLAHLARYPLSRSPSLGAFVAALTE